MPPVILLVMQCADSSELLCDHYISSVLTSTNNSTWNHAMLQGIAKACVRLPPAPSFSFHTRPAAESAQQDMHQGRQKSQTYVAKLSGSSQPTKTARKAAPLQTQADLQSSKLVLQANDNGQQMPDKQAPSVSQTGPRLNFKRIRTIK